jgi:hypothetical protein
METKNITKKLLVFQQKIETIKKDGKNAFFKKPDGKASTYATLPNILAAVKPILSELGLVITQPCDQGVIYTVITDSETGESNSSSLPLPTGLNAQQMGSAITYFRRYTLCSLLSLEIDEDDDGNEASKPKVSEAPKPTELPYLNKGTESYYNVVDALTSKKYTVAQVKIKYKLSKDMETELNNINK